MKKAAILLVLVFAGATLQQCSDDSRDNVSSSKVSFKIDVVSAGVTNPLPASNITSVNLILEKPDKSVVLQRVLQVNVQDNSITTESVELTQGEYRIREFSARDAQGNPIYILQINHPTSCEGDKNLLKTFYAGSNGAKTIPIVLQALTNRPLGS
jgi:hypothetical protein